MTLAEFIHVAQFYQTIICFSVLLLIGQRIIMLCKDLDEKYLKARAKEFDDQIDWQKSFSDQKQLIAKEQEEERQREEQRKRQQEERKRQQQQRQRQQEQRKAKQTPKQQNLRSSLVENQHEQTDRGLKQNQEKPQRRPSQERKSLVDLRKSQQKKVDVKDETKSQGRKSVERQSVQQKKSSEKKSQQAQPKEIQDQIAKENEHQQQSQRRNSEIVNQTGNRSSIESRKSQKSQKASKRNTTIKLQQQDLKNIDINKQQPSIDPHGQETQEDKLEREYKDKQKIRYFTRIDAIFNEYLPILLSVLIVGMLSHSTYIFTMVCFFGYMFSSLLFNYANLLSKLKNEPTQTSILSKVNKLIAGVFIIALFISYWFDGQFD